MRITIEENPGAGQCAVVSEVPGGTVAKFYSDDARNDAALFVVALEAEPGMTIASDQSAWRIDRDGDIITVALWRSGKKFQCSMPLTGDGRADVLRTISAAMRGADRIYIKSIEQGVKA